MEHSPLVERMHYAGTRPAGSRHHRQGHGWGRRQRRRSVRSCSASPRTRRRRAPCAVLRTASCPSVPAMRPSCSPRSWSTPATPAQQTAASAPSQRTTPQMQPFTMSDEEIVAAVESFTQDGDLYGLWIMAMADYDVEDYLRVIRLVRETAPACRQHLLQRGRHLLRGLLPHEGSRHQRQSTTSAARARARSPGSTPPGACRPSRTPSRPAWTS